MGVLGYYLTKGIKVIRIRHLDQHGKHAVRSKGIAQRGRFLHQLSIITITVAVANPVEMLHGQLL